MSKFFKDMSLHSDRVESWEAPRLGTVSYLKHVANVQ